MKVRKRVYQFFALTMAMIMFITSMNLVVDLHFCQGQFKSLSLLGKAKSCHEIAAKPTKACSHHAKKVEKSAACSMDGKDCCDNKTVHINADQDQYSVNAEFLLSQSLQQFVVTFVIVHFKYLFTEIAVPDFQTYRPPIVLRDIPVLLQSFLL